MDRLFFAFLLSGGLCCCVFFISGWFLQRRREKRYGRISSSVFLERYANRLYRIFSRSKSFVKFNNEIAYKISVFNTLSFDKNRLLSAAGISALGLLLCAASAAILVIYMPYWYIALVYIIVFNTSVLFALQLVFELIMNRQLKRMPEALRILQSRFLSKGSIAKAIHVSLPDLPKGIKSEMLRIYNALKQNEQEKAKETFREIDKKYMNEHMSVLLDLIWLAHYNGGAETIIYGGLACRETL